MNDDIGVKHYIEVVGFIIIFTMLGILLYQVSKPPLITKDTIDELRESISTIEKYTSKIVVITELTRQQIKENDLRYVKDNNISRHDYDDLSTKYGISKDESDKFNMLSDPSIRIGWVCSKNKNQ